MSRFFERIPQMTQETRVSFSAEKAYRIERAKIEAAIAAGDVRIVPDKTIVVEDAKRGIERTEVPFEKLEALTLEGARFLVGPDETDGEGEDSTTLTTEQKLAEMVSNAKDLKARAYCRGLYLDEFGTVDKTTYVERAIATFKKLGFSDEKARAAVALAMSAQETEDSSK